MKIGIISDTHLSRAEDCHSLAMCLLEGPFSEIEAVIHAGDVVTEELEYAFSPLPWYSVRGNMDHSLNDVPTRRILDLVGWRIGVVHGWGGPAETEPEVLASFASERLDVLIYGHTHSPVCYRHGDLLIMNPGSPTDRRRAPRHTVGILHLGDRAEGEIIALE